MLPNEELREWYEERAAIKEHHGGMSKKQAEEEAWDEMLEKMRREAAPQDTENDRRLARHPTR